MRAGRLSKTARMKQLELWYGTDRVGRGKMSEHARDALYLASRYLLIPDHLDDR
jgi:hypothetical protein